MKDLHKNIAVVGMACKYPDADNCKQLWENILSRRRSFRKMPECRLGANYFSQDGHPDTVYVNQASVLRDYHFNRETFKISGPSYRSADVAHWLALDVASQALKDAGFEQPDHLPLDHTGVFVGNTLTGEFTRANLTRLRWPYVARTLQKQLSEEGWGKAQITQFLKAYEATFKAPFPEMQEDSLAGGLSNTIAGRICNHFDFKGGGYTIDGACSSSLLAVEHACQAISTGDLDAALVGGVDLSLDPFELVGFSRAGALAKKEMLVYDERSAGFWPGEGCGFVVLMELSEAVDRGLDIYAVIKGWGVSSDGHGGLTRPVLEGQLLAMDRAYQKAGYDMRSIAYIEGHGTGTKVGDQTELDTISAQIEKGSPSEQPVAVGSVKANIGHTKAAAGIAGLIKAVMVLRHQLIPPASGMRMPHATFAKNPDLSLPVIGSVWQGDTPMRASVSAMGFGGINAHIALEQLEGDRRTRLNPKEIRLLSSHQDSELFLFAAASADDMLVQLERITRYAGQLSLSELTDLSCKCYQTLQEQPWKAAVVAGKPSALKAKLDLLISQIKDGIASIEDPKNKIYLHESKIETRIGYLFPGQGSQLSSDGGIFSTRFPFIRQLLTNPSIQRQDSNEAITTDVVQPTMIRTSIAAIELMEKFGISADTAVGHSVGELSALFWAGYFNQNDITALATERGRLMMAQGSENGGMLSVSADPETVIPLIANGSLVISAINAPQKTVVSGNIQQLKKLKEELKDKGIASMLLKVSHAFHSPMMQDTQEGLRTCLKSLEIQMPHASYVSTVTGNVPGRNADIRDLLLKQLTDPVRFLEAIRNADPQVDMWVELGCGRTLEGLASLCSDKPVYATEVGSPRLESMLTLIGCLFARGAEIHTDILFKHRFHRAFDLDWQATFLANPCEMIESKEAAIVPMSDHVVEQTSVSAPAFVEESEFDDIETYFRKVVAQKTELPLEAVLPESKMLDDLHLNSITVGQLIAETANALEIPMTQAPTEYANASISEIAAVLEQLNAGDPAALQKQQEIPEGLTSWVRAYHMELQPSSIRHFKETSSQEHQEWKMFSLDSTVTADAFNLSDLPGSGVLVYLKESDLRSITELLMKAVRHSIQQGRDASFILVQEEDLAAGFVKSFKLEYPYKKVMILNRKTMPDSAAWLVRELAACSGFSEVYYDKNDCRFKPEMQLLSLGDHTKGIPALEASDVFLISGGGKGITAECALAMASESHVRLGIIGRSDPDVDVTLRNNLDRMAQAGVRFTYVMADVTNEADVQNAVKHIAAEQGEITGILHGAGSNQPTAISQLDWQKTQRTLQPKFYGLQLLLKAIQPDRLKMLITFGSIIARSGMKGNADYAMANQQMARLVARWQSEQPLCICKNIEWSVWSGTGMGDQLGVLEQLMEQGIQPISIDHGVEIFLQILKSNLPCISTVVSGRNGGLETISMPQPELPLVRFLEQVKLFYPGVELITEFTLSSITDPYLEDHKIDGNLVFPAVMGLEAMAQVCSALTGVSEGEVQFRNLEFLSPIVCGRASDNTIRVIAQRVSNNDVEVVLRSKMTDFQQDHFRGICSQKSDDLKIMERPYTNGHRVELSPDEDLYGNILFHQGRFKCISEYKTLSPYACISVAKADHDQEWFGAFQSPVLMIGSPALRDAALHGVQACVPHLTLLPVSVRRVHRFSKLNQHSVFLFAKEVGREGDMFTYDIGIYDQQDHPIEVWEHVVFQAQQKPNGRHFNIEMANVILKRKLDEIGKEDVWIRLRKNRLNTSASTDIKRPDGKPLSVNGQYVSRSKSPGLILEAGDQLPIGCDIQEILEQPAKTWAVQLGKNRSNLAGAIAKELKEDTNASFTRVWGAIECLKKSGDEINHPLTFQPARDRRMVTFKSGAIEIISFYLELKTGSKPIICTLLVQHEAAGTQISYSK